MNVNDIPVRPHTVCSMPKMCVQSEYVLKLIEEIESEANGPLPKPKPLRKDHMKENLRRLRDIQARAKQRLSEKPPLQPLKAFGRLGNLPNKIAENGSLNKQEFSRPKTAKTIRTPSVLSEGGRPLHRSLPQLNQPDKSDEDFSPAKLPLEFPQHNKNAALTKKQEKKHRLGEIPSYLVERKKQHEAEQERIRRLAQEPSVPPGYRLLPNDERIETLNLLKKNQEELMQSLAALPVRNDTVRLKHRKEEMEKQLAKVEEGIKILSRPKVLIKNDS